MRKDSRRHICTFVTSGVEYTFRWDTFPLGANLFIPCVDTVSVANRIRRSAKLYGVEISTRTGIRDGKWGIAIWRIM